MFCGDFIERCQNFQAAFVEVFLDTLAAFALCEVRFRSIFPREKSTGQGEVWNDADAF